MNNQYGGLELILPSMDPPLPMFFLVLFVTAIQINRYTVRLAWRKGAMDIFSIFNLFLIIF